MPVHTVWKSWKMPASTRVQSWTGMRILLRDRSGPARSSRSLTPCRSSHVSNRLPCIPRTIAEVGRSRPDAAVERAVADGLGDVLGLDRVAVVEVGHGPRHPQDLVVGAGRQAELLHRRPEQALRLGPQGTMLAHLTRRHPPVDPG